MATETYWGTYRDGFRTADSGETRDIALRGFQCAHSYVHDVEKLLRDVLDFMVRRIRRHGWLERVTRAFEPKQRTEKSARAATIGRIREIVMFCYDRPNTAAVRALADAGVPAIF